MTAKYGMYLYFLCQHGGGGSYPPSGFEWGGGGRTPLAETLSILRNRLNNGKPTFAAFLVMEKAFHKVDRNLLLLRLLQYRIDDKIYYLFKNMYVDNIARVEVNNIFTDLFEV